MANGRGDGQGSREVRVSGKNCVLGCVKLGIVDCFGRPTEVLEWGEKKVEVALEPTLHAARLPAGKLRVGPQ